MADVRITELEELTSLLADDMFAVAENATTATKKVSYATISHRPHAMLSDSTTQSITNASNAQAITFNTNEVVLDITHSTVTNSDRIYVDKAGVYEIIISAIGALSGGTNQKLNMWFAVEGTNVARSNTIVNLGGASEQIVAVAYIYTFTAGQYFQVMISGSATTVRLLATGTQVTPTRPASPSIILTIKRISK